MMTGRRFLNIFQICSLILLLVTVALLAAIATMHFAIHGAEVEVPSLKGMTVAEARAQTSGLGLDLSVDNRYYSADVASGHILSQSPEPGTVVRREWHVRVAESLGPQTVDVPDTVGAEERKAMLLLRREGLNAGLVAHLPYADAPAGTVIAQDPPAHAHGIARPSVDLLLAARPDDGPDAFVMPDLTGLSRSAAQEALAKVGMKAAPAVRAEKATPNHAVGQPLFVAPGTVIAQQPAAGARVEQSTTVTLTVAQ